MDDLEKMRLTEISARFGQSERPKVRRILYDMSEAAEMLCIGRKALQAFIEDGSIRYVLIGKRRKFADSDIAEFIDSRRIECPSISRKARPTGTMTSSAQVIGFAARHAQQTKLKQKTLREPRA